MTVARSDAYDGERLARQIKAILQAGLPTALDAVELRWKDVAPVTLPDPKTYQLGFNPTLLEQVSADFPIIGIIPGERVPTSGVKAWGAQRESIVIDIHFFVVAATHADVGLIVWRYAEAIVNVLQANRVIGTFTQEDYKPEIEFGVAGRHPKTRGANMMKEADVDYVQGGRVTLELGGG